MTDFPEATPGRDALDAKQSMDEAERILLAAGWTPDDGWGGFFHGSCIGGLAPDGNIYVKNIAAIPPGHPKYSADTPDTFHEAAQWLADRYRATPPRIVLDEPGELVEDSGDEAHTQDAGAGKGDCGVGSDADGVKLGAGDDVSLRLPAGLEYVDSGTTEGMDEVGDGDADHFRSEAVVTDADFSEPAPELGQELAEEHPEEFGGAAFIFGDNLDQRRTAAIGMVMQAALRRLPAAINYAQLAELRNFTLGVSEGRWPDNAAKRDELDALEETERTRRRIEQVRDDKVAGLMSASREEIEAFDPEAGWPQ